MSLAELKSRLELYFAYTTKEVRDIIICVLFTAFIFSFNDWGQGASFNILVGIKNIFLVALLAALAFFVHLSAQRIAALTIGYKAEFKIWWGGLISSLFIVFITASLFGYGFPIILPGGIIIAMLVRHRLGEFRYGINYWESGITALWGPIATIGLAIIFKTLLVFFPQSWFLQKGLLINLVYAVCSMFPVPNLDGINVFFAGRILYTVSFGIILGIALLIYWANLILAIFGGIIIGLLILFLYFHYLEPFNK